MATFHPNDLRTCQIMGDSNLWEPPRFKCTRLKKLIISCISAALPADPRWVHMGADCNMKHEKTPRQKRRDLLGATSRQQISISKWRTSRSRLYTCRWLNATFPNSDLRKHHQRLGSETVCECTALVIDAHQRPVVY